MHLFVNVTLIAPQCGTSHWAIFVEICHQVGETFVTRLIQKLNKKLRFLFWNLRKFFGLPIFCGQEANFG